nr:FAD-linked oxidase [Gordonia sp. NB41Y]
MHDGLAAIVGRAHVLTDADMVAGFVTDWTGHWHGRTTAVVRPADTGEVSAVLALCHRAGIAVVPQGGNTGLVGGSIPMNGEVVLSTTRLDRIEEVDPVGRTLAAGAGVRVAAAQRAAAEHGLALGTDLASRESATLGGIVSTNAGGVAMVKNGSTRSRLLGVEAVLADGRVVTRWTPLTKDNIGYDLPGLLAGAEGTLAVITRVLLRLVLPARTTATVLAGVDTISAALTLRDAISAAGLTLEAGELMTADGLDLVCAQQGVRRPLGTRTAYTALFEVSGPADPATALVEVLSDADSGGIVVDAVLEDGHAPRLWHYREGHTESAAAASSTPVVKLDVAVPLPTMQNFLDELSALLHDDFPTVRPICFGHFVDGNVHVNLLDVPAARRDEVTDAVLQTVARHGGSISAEHGIGRAKLAWIGLGRDAVDRQIMAAVRAAFDPDSILNPHVLRFA